MRRTHFSKSETGTSISSSDALIVYKDGDTTITGTDNELPNQVLIGSGSILTEGLGDNRYVESGSSPGLEAVAIGNSTTASGDNSIVIGYDANTTTAGTYGMALGWGGTASGVSAIAVGYDAWANGQYSTAEGSHAQAQGSYSMAIGYGANSTTSGSYGMALGTDTQVNGYYATALGFHTTSTAYDSLAVGRYNVGGGNPSMVSGTDPLFEVGDGASESPSDALVVYQNGNTTVNGNATVNGTMTVSSTLKVSGSTGGVANAVLVNAAGDLSMGSFTAGPTPQ